MSHASIPCGRGQSVRTGQSANAVFQGKSWVLVLVLVGRGGIGNFLLMGQSTSGHSAIGMLEPIR